MTPPPRDCTSSKALLEAHPRGGGVKTIAIVDALKGSLGPGTPARVKGWARSRRDSKAGFSFIHLNDGSCLDSLQIVAGSQLPNYQNEILRVTAGCSLVVQGKLAASPAKGQTLELHADSIEVVGWVDDPETYPISAKQHSFEYLREVAHLRPRTNTFGAVARVRHTLAWAIHRFFDERGFLWVHTPIITTSDCEGGGALFRVSTLDLVNTPRAGAESPVEDETISSEPRQGARSAAMQGDEHRKRRATRPQATRNSLQADATFGASSKTGEGRADDSKDFFSRPAYLTVSGQLNAEAYCLALSKVYTFGPTFRAEYSTTPRHLAEFWMIEPEIAFADLNDDADLAEEFLKYIFRSLLDKRGEDLKFFAERIDKGCVERLENFVKSSFERISYTEAVSLLEKSGKNFQYPVKWGLDLQTEHERYLTEEKIGRPVVVMNYPKEIKAFYMRVNDDTRTVAAMDVLAPGIGEIIGGSQREERLDVLDKRLEEFKLNHGIYNWYRDLRRYGTVPHAGFGLGFERLLVYATGMANIRDVIPFPRTPGNASF